MATPGFVASGLQPGKQDDLDQASNRLRKANARYVRVRASTERLGFPIRKLEWGDDAARLVRRVGLQSARQETD